jgi:hypothetical protein
MAKKKNESYIYLGLRYAMSSFKFDAETIEANDPLWGDEISNPYLHDDYWGGTIPYRHLGQKGSMQWYELVGGVRAQIYKNFYMGWAVRLKYRLSYSAGEQGDPWYVPGFGQFGPSRMGVTYSLIYKLPFK